MKRAIVTIMLVMLSFTAVLASHKHHKQPQGYWVIESTVKNADQQTIKFYTEGQNLLYQYQAEGEINVSDKKVQSVLNEVLTDLLKQDVYKPTISSMAAVKMKAVFSVRPSLRVV